MTVSDFTKRRNNALMHPSTMLYYKNLQKILDARKTRASDITIRRQIMESQNRNNYQLEYDRIRGQLDQSVLKGLTIPHLDKRKKELELLGIMATKGLH
jgi:hypothetical protein